MPSYSAVGLLGTANPTFSTNVTDLDIAWIGGQPRLISTTLAGPGAGYALFDLSAASGPAGLVTLQSYSTVVHHGSRPEIAVLPGMGGSGGSLIAAGLTPSGWASYGLGPGGFGPALNSPFAFDPTTVTGFSNGSANFIYLAAKGSAQPMAFWLQDNGTMVAISPTTGLPPGANLDSMAIAQTGYGTYLVTASAAGNILTSYSVNADGSLTHADDVSVDFGIGFSKPTEVATVTLHGLTFVIAAASESSSLSTFRALPGGILYETDHVVDSLWTRFSGATALATLDIGGRVFVLAGGADDGVEVMTLLPDGRLIQMMTISDTATTSLADVTTITAAQIGGRVQMFVASATEPGITQMDLDLGQIGISLFRDAGIQTGTGANDLLYAGSATTAIYGGGGDDLIVGGGPGAAAALYGGADSDLFILSPASGTIVIGDYQAGIDRLDLTAFPMLRNIDQLLIAQTATGASITFGTTTILINSFDGNPIPATAFAQSQMLRLTRYAPTATTQIMVGTTAADLLTAAAEDTSILGLRGDDRLNGGIGQDVLDGGDGNDTLAGGENADRLLGGAGADLLTGSTGNDTLDGGADNDALWGDQGDDCLWGGAGSDDLHGGDGNDTLDGGDGSDTLWGNWGDDVLAGGLGNDTLHGDGGNDLLYGGDGADALISDGGDDTLFAGAQDDWIAALDGSDLVWCGTGNDVAFGGTGADTIHGEAGNDQCWGDADDDLMTGGAGADTLWGGSGNDTLDGGDDNDWLIGEAGNDSLVGGAGNDTLGGRDGNDTLQGGLGDDTLAGHASDDLLFGGDGNDFFGAGDGNDSLYGGDGNDVLLAEAGANLIDGGAGDDTLSAYGQNDSLYGGDGNDILSAGLGTNLIYCGRGTDSIWGDNGNDEIWGEAGTDYIFAAGGDDRLIGGAGRDYLWGGTGADVFVYTDPGDMGHRNTCDILHDFIPGVDKLDFTGAGLRFSGSSFTGQAGELRFTTDATGGNLWLDLNGDRVADLSIRLEGTFALSASDMFL